MNYDKAIEDKGFKKKHLAKKLGISNVLLSYYLRGTRPMPTHIAEKLKIELK